MAGETERAQGWTPEPLTRTGIAIGALPILSFMVMWWFAGNVLWRMTHLPDSAPLVLIVSLAGGVAAGFLSDGGVRAGITSGLLSGLLSLAAFALLLILQASMSTVHAASAVIWPIALAYMAFWALPTVAVGGAIGGAIAPGRGGGDVMRRDGRGPLPMTRPFVKICGVTRPEDARAAVEAGADAIGVVMASESPRTCSVEAARAIFAAVPPGVLKVVVSHTGSAEGLADCLAAGPGALQLSQPIGVPASAGVAVIRVVAPGDPIPGDCDMVIVDASHGRGEPYDPVFARAVVAASPVPVLLAGGLSPGNVGVAIREVRPYGVDVATGVESAPGIKDHARVQAFVRAAKRPYLND